MADVTARMNMLLVDLGYTSVDPNMQAFLTALLASAEREITRTGVVLTDGATEDDLFVSMYAAWMYRKRAGGDSGAMPPMIRQQLHNRLMAQKMGGGT